VKRSLLDVVLLAALSGVLVLLWLLFQHDAWSYYTSPLAIRGYHAEHRFLRPSGDGGHLLGVAGTSFLFATLAYVARRRVRRLSKAGSVAHWLEAHIFCGLFGPILVTFHTSLKFNGLVSVAYWSMALVVVSGFVGRYLYVRIPKTIRGDELTRAELDQRASAMARQLAETALSPRLRAMIDEEQQRLLHAEPFSIRSSLARRRRNARLRREIRASVLNRTLLHEALSLARERAVLLRRIARLDRTRRLFHLWHVFHRPLVWVMFVVFFFHLGVALYFGYVPFGG
jgi:hypothetical protein